MQRRSKVIREGELQPESAPMSPSSACVHRPRGRRGLWIALFGPDGAGKSAVAECMAHDLSSFFTATHRHHLRMPLRAHKKLQQTVTEPHRQAPRGALLSHAKLLYLFVHCWLCHLLVTLPRLASGHLVIFDRYFPDHMIDPRRYRLAAASTRLAAGLSRLVPQPDVQIVLDVPAEALWQRKQEVTLAELKRQRVAYREKIGALAVAAITDASRPLAEVACDVNGIVLAKLFAMGATS